MIVPVNQQVHDNLMRLLEEGMNVHLATFGEPLLSAGAFAPVVQGDPTGDMICAAWSAKRREPPQFAYRDDEVIFTVNIWAFGVDDDAAQTRAMALEAAAIAVLDDPANRYLDGVCSKPVEIGDTRCATAEDESSPNLMWHLGFPVLCPVRTTRPQ